MQILAQLVWGDREAEFQRFSPGNAQAAVLRPHLSQFTPSIDKSSDGRDKMAFIQLGSI